MLNIKINDLSYNEFMKEVEEGNVVEVFISPQSRTGVYQISGKLEGYEEEESFLLEVPLSNESLAIIYEAQAEQGFKLDTVADSSNSLFLSFLFNVVPIILMLGLAYFFLTKQMGSANKSMDFGKSRAKLSDSNHKVTFDQVAGLDEEKEEVKELIDFLKNPKKFTDMGARIPKGVLLFGPPGTGKTLLARSVAGEANVPFYYISGSEFVELFVGVGASRVRDMFKQAKETAPCLIFIDEIDAVGRQRGTGLGGGHDEREQTLNQLLTEMDGFGANEGIIVMAATNRPDVLDPALLRPGRFDRQITVNLPDLKGREEILKVHAKGKTFSKKVNLKNIAKRTVGLSGADLENLLNEAALLAARKNLKAIRMEEIEEATIKVVVGTEKKSRVMNDKEKTLTAYHEAGHAVVSRYLETQDPVHQISIIPRGMAGGYTMYRPTEDKSFMSKTETKIVITSNNELEDNGQFSITLTDIYGTAIADQIVNITFVDGNGSQNTQRVVTDANGNGVFTLNGLASGQYTVNVIYGGNDNYLNTLTSQELTIKEKATQTQNSERSLESYKTRSDTSISVMPSGDIVEMDRKGDVVSVNGDPNGFF